MNQKDDLIPDRLFKIGVRSYWSNTFLFSLGYLAKHKRYLIYSIESLCSRSNEESTDKSTDSRINAICRFGSWLALDILNEGVFRALPNHEQLFIQYLRYLFELPYSRKHSEIAKLPRLILEQLVPILNTNLKVFSFDRQLTSWLLMYDFFQNGYKEVFYGIVDNWPKSDEDSTELLRVLIKQNCVSDVWTIDKLEREILKRPHGDIVGILFQERSDALMRLASYALLLDSTRSLLLSRAILVGLSDLSPRYIYEVIHALSEGAFARDRRRIKWFSNLEIFDLVSDYVVSFRTIRGKLSIEAKMVNDLLPIDRHSLLKYIFDFIDSPKYEVLKEIVALVRNLSPHEVEQIRQINWLFGKIFAKGKKPEVEVQLYTDVSKWRKLDRELIDRDDMQFHNLGLMSFCHSYFFDGDAPVESLEDFYAKYYVPAKSEGKWFDLVAEYFVKLAGESSENVFDGDATLSASLQDALIDCVSHLHKVRDMNGLSSELISVISFLSDDRIDYFFSSNRQMLRDINFETFDFFATNDAVARQALLNTIGSFQRDPMGELLPLMLCMHLYQVTFVGEDEYLILPFDRVLQIECSQQLENYKCIILLFDKDFNERKYRMVMKSLESIVENCRATFGYVFQAEHLLPSDLMTELIIQVRLLKCDDIITVDFLREYIERKPSGVSSDVLRFV